MNFLYANTGQGVFSSLMGSWIFWLVIVLVVVVIVLLVLNNRKKLQRNLRLANLFEPDGRNDDSSSESDFYTEAGGNDGDAHKLIDPTAFDEFSDEDGHAKSGNVYNGYVPDLNKYLDADLDEELEKSALPLGRSDTDKNVKLFYHVSSKKESVFKVADPTLDAVNFKLELRDLSKLTLNAPVVSEMKLYNQDRKCIAIFFVDTRQITVKSISPFFDDVVLPLEESTRLLAFTQKANKLFVDSKQVAAFNIYDQITYFYIKSPIIKELQYL